MLPPVLLGIDVGTTSAKSVLYEPDGSLVAEAVEPCRVERPRDGWLEQDPAEIWRAASAAVRRTGRTREVDAVGVCGHSPTLILLDRAGRPTRPAILWQDRRAAAEAAELAERVPTGEMA